MKPVGGSPSGGNPLMGCSPCTAQTQMGPGWRKRPGSLRPLAQSRVLLRGGAKLLFSFVKLVFCLSFLIT